MRLRPATRDDERSVLALARARDLHDFGVGDLSGETLVAQWRIEDFDPANDARIAVSGGAIAGYAALFDEGGLGFVDPGHEGRGIGSELLAWLEVRSRERGIATCRQRIAEHNPSAHALLSAAGYDQVRSVILMTRELSGAIEVPPPPVGITLSPLDVAADAEQLHAADEAAFGENDDFEPNSLAAFRQEHLEAPGLAPEVSRIARRDGRMVGFTLCRRGVLGGGYIDLLAVDPSARRQGLGNVLLHEAFHGFAAAGLPVAWLDVSSSNAPARRLYQRAGMEHRHSFAVLEKPAG